MSKVDGMELKVVKREVGLKQLLESVFDTCSSVLNLKLTQLSTMAAINAGIATQSYLDKPCLFTMHDGVSFGDEILVAQKLMGDTLLEIKAKHINDKVIEPFEVVKEFAKLVDKITFEFI